MYRIFTAPLFLLSMALTVACGSYARAEEPAGVDLAKLAMEARGDHEPFTDEKLTSLRDELRTSAEALDRALSRQGQEFAAAWKEYLLWEQLEPQLSDEAQINRRDLDAVLKRFRANKPGLELPVFVRTAEAIEQFRTIAPWVLAGKVRDSGQDYDRLMAGLAAQLHRHQETATTETAWKTSRVLDLISQLQQSPQLMQAFHEQYVRPNVQARVSQSLIDRVARERPVGKTQPITDCILGTSIRGTANMVGSLAVGSQPSPDEIQMDVLLSGNVYSSTRGYQKPVSIRSTSTTGFAASKRVMIDDDAFRTTLAVVDADTHSHIHSIHKTGGRLGHRLIEKIAWKKACKSKSCAESIASRHAEQRIAEQFDAELAEALTTARSNFETKVRAPLVRRDAYPEHLLMASGADGVRIETTFASGGQFAADSPPPPMVEGCDIAMQIHQSAVNNYIPLVMSGVSIRQDTEDQQPQLIGDLPPWMEKLKLEKPPKDNQKPMDAAASDDSDEAASGLADDDEPKYEFQPWSITLNDEQPASVTFDAGKLVLRMRSSHLVSDEKEYRNWDFIVTYQVEQKGNEIMLRRVGQIEVFPTGFDPQWDTKMSAKNSGFRSTLAKNMNARAERGESFPAEIPIKAIRLPEEINVPGELVLRQLECTDGWLTVGYALPSGE